MVTTPLNLEVATGGRVRSPWVDPLDALLGESAAVAGVRDTVRSLLARLARARRAPPILILGETGTGKGLLAQAIHRSSARAAGPFVDVNCAAIPETLLEAELFGFERGAFTDAREAKAGLLEAAHRGTLLLDEVGLLAEPIQRKLLTALAERSVRRLGSTRAVPVDVWLLAATNTDLEAAVRARRFREDLFHRLAALVLRLPPLRERGSDVVLIAEHLLRKACVEAGVPPKTLGPDAGPALRAHRWPGNVRELDNAIQRVVALSDAAVVTAADLALPPGPPAGAPAAARATAGALDDAAQVRQALEAVGWNISHAASRLGLSRNTLRHRIEKYGLRAGLRPPAAARAPHNLVEQLTSFIGRETEIAQAHRLLAVARLVSLTGPGGAGKTRLALEVARASLDRHPDGVWLVELGPITEPTLVAEAVAAALTLNDTPAAPLLERLAGAVQDRRMLLVLDGCEHLLDAAASLAESLLRAGQGLRVLATSREPLGVGGEVTLRVPPLALPAPDRLPPVEELAGHEAIRLFVDRARTARLDFALTDRNALAVAQICYRLDGLPLAIELAASRVKVLPVEQINARLHDRFRLLASRRASSTPRHHTLRAAMDWSHDLLSPAERVLLHRLAVFNGSFSLEAAEAICPGPGLDPGAVLDLLSHLVDRSMVNVQPEGGAARFRLLETVRVYALEKLEEAGEREAFGRRHQDWYLELAERARTEFEGEIAGGASADWVDRLESDYDNLRAALAWRGGGERASERSLRLAAALWRFWAVGGRRDEGRAWLEALLASEEPAAPAVRARALAGLAILLRTQGSYDRARGLQEEALTLRRAVGDEPGVAASLSSLGNLAHDIGNFADAAAHHEQALAFYRERGNAFDVATALNNLGRAVRFQGDHTRAASLLEESLRHFRRLGHAWGIARALHSLGDLARRLGQEARARECYEESLALRRAARHRQGIAVCLSSLSDLARQRGDLETAAALGEEALDICQELGDRRGLAVSLTSLALLARRRGDIGRARALAVEAGRIRCALGDRAGMVASLETLATVALAGGETGRAARLLGAADRLREEIGAPPDEYERDVAAARAVVGPALGGPDWQAGRTMSCEALLDAAP